MTKLEQRVKMLEEEAARESCNHPDVLYLSNPTEEELAKVEEKLEACPNCNSREGRPLMVILKCFDELYEPPLSQKSPQPMPA